jgi:serine protease Do
MTIRRLAARTALTTLLLGLVWSATATAAAAGPTTQPTSRGVRATLPAVVSVAAAVRGTVTDKAFKQEQQLTVPLGKCTGFSVNPDGWIVTAGHCVSFGDKELRNQLLYEYLTSEGWTFDDQGNIATWDGTPISSVDRETAGTWVRYVDACFTEETTCEVGGTDRTGRHLAEPEVLAYVARTRTAGADFTAGSQAIIRKVSPIDGEDVAVLKVETRNLPTVQLGTTDSLKPQDGITAVGYPVSVSATTSSGTIAPSLVSGIISAIRVEDGSRRLQTDARLEEGMSGGPVLDGAGKVIGLVSYGTTRESGETAFAYVRTAESIRAAMAEVGVSNTPGPTDLAFRQALELLDAHHYQAALTKLQEVANLDPDHDAARQLLADAQAAVAAGRDVPVQPRTSPSTADNNGGLPLTLVLAALAVVLVVVTAGTVLLVDRRRRQPHRRSGINLPEAVRTGDAAEGNFAEPLRPAPNGHLAS